MSQYYSVYVKMTKYIWKKGDFLISNDSNLVFNIVDREIVPTCTRSTFYRSSEGLFITKDQSALALPLSTEGTTDLTKFVLAEEDMARYQNYESQRHLSYEMCLNVINSLRIAKMVDNKFLIIKDTRRNDLILYTSDNELYMKCHKLDNKSQ